MEKLSKFRKIAFWGLAAGTITLLLFNFSYMVELLTPYFTTEQVAVFLSPSKAQPTQPDYLVIPSLDISAPIIHVNQKNEAVFQEALGKGVVQYPGTAPAGAVGNTYIFGHSSDFPWAKGSYKTVFARLPQIEEGEAVIISDSGGRAFTYHVTQKKVISPDEVQYLRQPEDGSKMLTLQTSYPLGTALKRFIVIAKIAENK